MSLLVFLSGSCPFWKEREAEREERVEAEGQDTGREELYGKRKAAAYSRLEVLLLSITCLEPDLCSSLGFSVYILIQASWPH